MILRVSLFEGIRVVRAIQPAAHQSAHPIHHDRISLLHTHTHTDACKKKKNNNNMIDLTVMIVCDV